MFIRNIKHVGNIINLDLKMLIMCVCIQQDSKRDEFHVGRLNKDKNDRE